MLHLNDHIHLDTLGGLDTIKACHTYTLDGETETVMPTTTERWGQCDPSYRTFDGWPEADWEAIASEGYEALPENAKTYVEYLATELDVPIYALGVGADRDATIIRRAPFE